jgi:hypothetical protein
VFPVSYELNLTNSVFKGLIGRPSNVSIRVRPDPDLGKSKVKLSVC